jgi:hypothetical protein
MSDVSAAPTGDAAAALPAMETFREAAENRFAALRADLSFGQKILAGDAAAANERRTLIEILHGDRDEAAVKALAASIKLEPRPTLAAARRAAAETVAAASAGAPQYSYKDRTELGGAALQGITTEMREWTAAIGLPTTVAKTVTQAIADSGVRGMDGPAYTAWRDRQDAILLGAAHGDRKVVEGWRAAASKVLAGGKFSFDNSPVLHNAFVIRHLAHVGASRK